MSTSEKSPDTNCVYLTGDNYEVWAQRMHAYLVKQKVWYTVAKTTTLPTSVDLKARINKWTLELYQYQWTEDAENAICLIISYLDTTRSEEIKKLQEANPAISPKEI